MNRSTDEQMAQIHDELGRVNPTGVTHDFRQGRWEHRCCWTDLLGHRKTRFVGWSRPRPKPGDEFLRRGPTGVEFRYVVVAVRLVSEPDDMFFLDAIGVGYPTREQIAQFDKAS